MSERSERNQVFSEKPFGLSLRAKPGFSLVILLAYIGVAVGMTWPLAARLATHIPGNSWDILVHYWNGWWVRQALTTGQSPFYTSYLFHPRGLSLVYHNFAWLSIIPWLMLEPWVGGFAAYNLSLLVNLALCGFAVFLLTRDLTGDERAAFLAGLIYQCWPFRLSQLDHPNLISTQWIPLFLLFLIRAVRKGRWRDGALAGVFLALTGYTRWQLLIPAAIAGGVYLACTLPGQWTSRRPFDKPFDRLKAWLKAPRWAPALLLAGGVAAVALTPPILLLAGQQRIAPADLLIQGEEDTKQTDLLAYLTPGGSHPVVGTFTQPAYDHYYANRSGGSRFYAYVGVTALALALLGVWKARRTCLPWAVMALVLFLLALGPILRINGRLYPAMPMPYRLAARSFVVRLLRFPDRFNMFLALPVAVLAAYGVAGVLAFVHQRSNVFLCLLGGAILFEYAGLPVPLQQPQTSPFYVRLAAEPADFAVLNLPIDPQKSKPYMFAQTTHHHPILQGKTARFPEGASAYLDGHPWLRGLRQSGEMDPGLTDVSRQLESLAEEDVRYVILHKTHVGTDRLTHWQRYLLIAPRFEDEQIAVYITTPLAGRDFTLADELAPGIGFIRIITSIGCLNPGGVLEVDVGWGSTAAPGRDFQVKLALVSDGDAISQVEVFPLSPAWPTREWPANGVAWGYYTLRTHPSLPTGVYTITLALVDPATGATVGQPAVVGQVMVSQSPCLFSIPPDAVGVNALFGDDLRLLGYQLRHDTDRLTVTLHWRSERRMQTDYKIFVHVFDPATATPVAQDDAMPHRWTYPTTFWSPGEAVMDVIPISLEGAPAGAYGIAIGIYDPATTERLPVIDGTGQPQPDGRLVLPGEMIEVKERGP